MSTRVLRVALIGGPQYDELYSRLLSFEDTSGYRVEIVAQLPHPALNAFLADAFASGGQPGLDLVSTHVKYAPSQAHFLLPLDEYIASEEVKAFLPSAIRASRFNGRLLQLPRMVDARLLFYRSDLLQQIQAEPPATWNDLSHLARRLHNPPLYSGYAFPGKQSGLFGTFFELVAMAGGRLFDAEGRAIFEHDAVSWALHYLRSLCVDGVVAPDIADIYFDEVSALFRQGHLVFAADWPAFFALYNDSATSSVTGSYGVMRYPVGPAGKRAVYAGMHSFAIPTTTRNVQASLALLRFLLDEESQWLEAQRGAFPTRLTTLQRLQASQLPGSLQEQRRHALTKTVKEDMLMFPHLRQYPLIEDTLWPLIQQTMLDRMPVADAVTALRMQAQQLIDEHA